MDRETEMDIVAKLGYVFVCLVLMLASIFVGGFTVQCLWQWFAVPAFSVAPLSLVAAVGLRILVACFTFQLPPIYKNQETIDCHCLIALFVSIILNVVWLLAGFVIHLFM